MDSPYVISKESLIHKSLKDFEVPEAMKMYDYVDTVFFNMNYDDLTAAHIIFQAFQNNNDILNRLSGLTLPDILEKRKLLLSNIVTANGFQSPFDLKNTTIGGSLHSAVALDNIEFLKENMELIKFHRNTNFIDLACKYGSIKCYKFLKLNGTISSANAPKYAIQSGNIEIIMDFYNNGVNFDNFFQAAVNYRKYDIADWILDNYPQVEISFHDCLWANNIRASCFCLENKIPLTDWNFMSFVVFLGKNPVHKYLLDYASDELIDQIYEHYCLIKNLYGLKELVAHGYNVNRIFHNTCPLLIAAENGDDRLYQFFIDHGADENLDIVHHIYLIENILLKIVKIDPLNIDFIHANLIGDITCSK